MKKIKEDNRASFKSRFLAYLIDFVIIFFIAGLIIIPFSSNVSNDDLDKDLKNEINLYYDGEISANDLMIFEKNYTYSIARSEGLITIITVLVELLYFVILQFYMKGKTIGKKICKIKVISNNGELSVNQLLFRSLIIDSILLQLIEFILMLFAGKDGYFYGLLIFEIIQYSIIIISFIMIISRDDKKGIHDMICDTSVVKE